MRKVRIFIYALLLFTCVFFNNNSFAAYGRISFLKEGDNLEKVYYSFLYDTSTKDIISVEDNISTGKTNFESESTEGLINVLLREYHSHFTNITEAPLELKNALLNILECAIYNYNPIEGKGAEIYLSNDSGVLSILQYDGTNLRWGNDSTKSLDKSQYQSALTVREYVQRGSYSHYIPDYNETNPFGINMVDKNKYSNFERLYIKKEGSETPELLSKVLTNKNILIYLDKIASAEGAKYNNLKQYINKSLEFDSNLWDYVGISSTEKYKLRQVQVSAGVRVYLDIYVNGKNVQNFLIGTKKGDTFYEELFINEMASDKSLTGTNSKATLKNSQDSYSFLIYKNNTNPYKLDRDYLLILNARNGNINIMKKQSDNKTFNCVTYIDRGIFEKAILDKTEIGVTQLRYKLETKEYYITKEENSYLVEKINQSNREKPLKSARFDNKFRELRAEQDEDGFNNLYYLKSDVLEVGGITVNSDGYIGYYYAKEKSGADAYKNGKGDQLKNSNFFANAIANNDKPVFLAIAQLQNKYIGYGEEDKPFKKELKNVKKYTMSTVTVYNEKEKSYDYMRDIPVNELLSLPSYGTSTDGIKSQIIMARATAEFGIQFLDDKTEMQKEYKEWVFRLGRSIVLFLVFLTLLIASLMMILNNNSPEERTKIALKYHHIIVGATIFLCATFALALLTEFTTSSFNEIEAISSTYTGPSNEIGILDSSFGGFGHVAALFINLGTEITGWFIKVITETESGQDYDLIAAVFGVYDNTGYKVDLLSPFTKDEWNKYMLGYKALTGIGVSLLSIAFIRIACLLALNSGNAEKVAEEKKTAQRIIVAVLMIILAPYFVRILLGIFNYLVAMLPVNPTSSKFKIKFPDAGLISAMGNAAFIITELRIFLSLFVRKIMITIMVMATPIVFGMWAISDKTRSLSLWIGELVSNAATQFCYALVFFIILLITHKDQSPFIMLAITMLIPQFANFFKDSLQGYVQRWGGINEDEIAGESANSVKGIIDNGKKKLTKNGARLQKLGQMVDKDGTKDIGRVLNNTGKIMQFAGTGFKTRGDTLKARRKKAIIDHAEALRHEKVMTEKSNNEIEASKDSDFKTNAQAILDGNKEKLEEFRNDPKYKTIVDTMDARRDEQEKAKIKELAIQDVNNYFKDDYKKDKDGNYLRDDDGKKIPNKNIFKRIDKRLDPNYWESKLEDKELAPIEEKYKRKEDEYKAGVEKTREEEKIRKEEAEDKRFKDDPYEYFNMDTPSSNDASSGGNTGGNTGGNNGGGSTNPSGGPSPQKSPAPGSKNNGGTQSSPVKREPRKIQDNSRELAEAKNVANMLEKELENSDSSKKSSIVRKYDKEFIDTIIRMLKVGHIDINIVNDYASKRNSKD